MLQTEMKKKTKKATMSLLKGNKKERLLKIKPYQYLYLNEKVVDQEEVY